LKGKLNFEKFAGHFSLRFSL